MGLHVVAHSSGTRDGFPGIADQGDGLRLDRRDAAKEGQDDKEGNEGQPGGGAAPAARGTRLEGGASRVRSR